MIVKTTQEIYDDINEVMKCPNKRWVSVDSLKKELDNLKKEYRGFAQHEFVAVILRLEKVLFGEASNEKTSEEVPKTLITTLNCELCRFFPKKCRVYRARKYYPCSEFERS